MKHRSFLDHLEILKKSFVTSEKLVIQLKSKEFEMSYSLSHIY